MPWMALPLSEVAPSSCSHEQACWTWLFFTVLILDCSSRKPSLTHTASLSLVRTLHLLQYQLTTHVSCCRTTTWSFFWPLLCILKARTFLFLSFPYTYLAHSRYLTETYRVNEQERTTGLQWAWGGEKVRQRDRDGMLVPKGGCIKAISCTSPFCLK